MADRDLSGRTLGEFVLREQIGSGGYGSVYRSEQTLLDRDVAIKVLHERRRDEISQRRFLREARLASRLKHPYAAHVYASGVEPEDGLLWIAMELVHGVTLADWLKSHGPMPLDQLVPIFEDIAEVVHAAHEQGIIHRDLKPSNIMVIARGVRRIPKLLDFGTAKMIFTGESPVPDETTLIENDEPEDEPGSDERATVQKQSRLLTPPGAAMGSRAYMSPEQWRDAWSVGPETDIYSLGIVIYESLTGRQPFTAERTDDYYEQHLHAPVPPLGDRLPQELDRVLQRALAKRFEARHHDALELASDLRAALRVSKREQLRSSARQWEDAGRAPGLLWGRDMLAKIEHQVRRDELSGLECSFVADSQRRARRIRLLRGMLGVVAVLTVLGVFLMRARMAERQAELQTQLAQEETRFAQEKTRAAQQVAEATITQSELEQGRAALLHGEPEAAAHLGRAYQRGDRSPSTTFMLARALQSHLAEQVRLTSVSGRMWSAAYSADGRQIVTTDDKAAQVWDAQTYRRMFVLFHGESVYGAAYSPDGARIVTAGGDGTVKIWDTSSGALVRELRDDARSRYFAVATSPDGRFIAAIDVQGDIANVWDATTGKRLVEIRNDASGFPAIAFSADGRWLATTGGDDVRVFDVQARRRAVTLRTPRIRGLAFDPTGPRLLTGAATGDVAIWVVPSGARHQHLRDVSDPIEAVAFSPDGRLTAAGSRDGALQIWRAASGELLSQLGLRRSNITAVEFDRTSRFVLAAGADGAVVVAEAALGMPATVLDGQQGVLVAHFDPTSRHVVGASLDGIARVWDATSPYRRWGVPAVSDGCGLGPSPEPDGRFIAVGCKDRPTRVWDTARGQLLAELPGTTPIVGDFASAAPAVSGTGDRAAIARENAVEVYELPGGRLLRTITHGAAVSAVAFGGTTTRDIVSGAADGSLLVTRDSGAPLALPASAGGVDAVSFAPDGRVVAADAQRRLRVYDSGGTALADLELPARIASLQIREARLIAVPLAPPLVASVTSPVLVDFERYRVVAQLEGHVGRVYSARWVAEDQILTGGADGTARRWDAATGEARQVYRGGSRILTDLALSPDGLVMAGGADGVLQFWDRDGRLLWMLRAHAAPIIGVHVEGDDIVTRGFAGELARWTLPSPGQVIRKCGDYERCAMLLR